MANAVAAAKTSSMLTAEITAKIDPATGLYETWLSAGSDTPTTDDDVVGGGVFSVTFSDNVVEPDPDAAPVITDAERHGTALDPTMYRINGRRVEAASTANPASEPASLVDLVFTANRTVTVRLSHILEPGDTITVDNSLNEAAGLRLGAKEDKRKLEPASLTLGPVSPPVDRTAPVVEIVAVPGTTTFDILVTEPNILHSEIFQNAVQGTNLADFVKVQFHGRNATRKATEDTVTLTAAETTDLTAPMKANGRATVHQRYRITSSIGLERGDVVIVERKAILDRGGRGSPLIRHTVPRVKTNTPGPTGTGNLEVQSVSIGNYAHGTQAKADIATDMDVLAKATGIASGARGNDWRIFGYDDRPNATTNTNAFEIDVAVDTTNQRISYTISQALPVKADRAPTIGDLAAELVSNDDFNANFALQYENNIRPTAGKGTALTATAPAGVAFTGGRSSVGVVVKFNNAIASLTNDGTDLAVDIAARINTSATVPDVVTVSLLAPDNQVHISYTSASTLRLPARSGFRVIAAGVATGYADTTDTPSVDTAVANIREILNSLRPDSNIKP
ncbi:MAG: hypothetical protein OXI97_12065, partial [Acidimicrobiaceae bacterium]|nr:hypothetical protein [Acidimicrobiaceae bacterium]